MCLSEDHAGGERDHTGSERDDDQNASPAQAAALRSILPAHRSRSSTQLQLNFEDKKKPSSAAVISIFRRDTSLGASTHVRFNFSPWSRPSRVLLLRGMSLCPQ